MSKPPKEDTSPATKADINDLRDEVVAFTRGAERRFKTYDEQFQTVVEYIRAEGEETRRHFDAGVANLRNYLENLVNQHAAEQREALNDHERRIRALERGQRTKVAA